MSVPDPTSDAQALAVRLSKQPTYIAARVLPDDSVAVLMRLAFTYAIATGCTDECYDRRFCFDDMGLAMQRFMLLESEDDIPEGYVARRGSFPIGQ